MNNIIGIINKNYDYILNDKNNILTIKKSADLTITLDKLPNQFQYLIDNDCILLKSLSNQKNNACKVFTKKITGTYKSLINGAHIGLEKPYKKTIEILGVGYKFINNIATNGQIKVFIGYTNPIYIKIDPRVKCEVDKTETSIVFTCINKQLIGEVAAKFLRIRKFNVYSYTGIKYKDKIIKKKTVTKKH